jgi:maltose alpha-D-glucosyltransferase / alpha-amylase
VEHPAIEIDQWESLFINDHLEQLESEVFPAYMQKMDWFATNKKIYSTSILSYTSLPAGDTDVFILLVEVNFESGLSETYHLPLMFVKEKAGKKIMDDHPSAILAHIRSGSNQGFLVDAVYATSFQQTLFDYIAGNKRFMGSGEMVFQAKETLPSAAFHSKVHLTNKVYTAVTYGNEYFLKVYRRVDKGMHPDTELTRYLSGLNAGIATQFSGSIEWNTGDTVYNLAMLEKLEENHGDGYSYMHERVANYIERILARDRKMITAYKKEGSFATPVSFESLDEERREFIGSSAADVAKAIGRKLVQIHRAFATGMDAGFVPEEFSLHYQRSLFSSMTTLVRETMQSISRKMNELPPGIHKDLEALTAKKDNILHELKKVYSKKFDVLKIRIHGNMNLRHVLLTGKDLLIHDFAGNPLKPFSARRLKRSPLRDVAAMIHSFYYVAYESILSSAQVPADDHDALLPFADLWAHYMSSFFLSAYMEGTKEIAFIPVSKEDFDTLLNCFLLEHALQWFNYELNHHTDKAIVLLRVLETIMKQRDI